MEIPKKYRIKNKIWIEPTMYYSDAYQSIKKSASTIDTLLRCLQKRKWKKIKVNGKKQIVYTDDGFIFSYTEAKELNICSVTQFWKNLKKLVEVGFLDVVHQGGRYQKHESENDYSVYKLSGRWRKYGTPEFEKVEKTKVLQECFYIRKNMERKKIKSTSFGRSEQLHSSEGREVKSDNSRLHSTEVDKKAIEGRQTLADAI